MPDAESEADPRVVKWTSWVENEIKNDVLTLFHYRAVYRPVARSSRT